MPRKPESRFARLGWSTMAAQVAEQLALAAAPMVAVLALAAAPAETALLQAAQTLPFLLFSIPIGIVIDRAAKRTIMALGEVLRATALLSLVALLTSGHLSLWLLAGFGFLGAVGTVCFTVAAPALLPLIVAPSQLTSANRWLELARSGAFVAGPALGGALVGQFGASPAYLLAFALSATSVALLMTIREPAGQPAPPRPILADLREGVAFVFHHPLLRPICLTAVFFNLSWFVMHGIFVAYAMSSLAMDASAVGLVLGIYGAGLVIGAAATPALGRRLSTGTLILIGPACGAFGATLVLATLWFPTPFLVALAYFLLGAGPMIWSITTMTLRQAVTPTWMLGRVSAVIVTATTGAAPLGAILGAGVASTLGVGACLGLASVGFLVQFGVIVASPVRRLRHQPDGAAPAT